MSKVYPDFKVEGSWVKNFTVDKKSIFTKSASIWYNMRKRCSNIMVVKNPAYKDVICSENFKDFQYFAEWCQNQKGYSNIGWELDKDILLEGNRVYSEHNCVFVPPAINALLVKPKNTTNTLPQGCFPIANSLSYKACIQNKGKLEYLGCFKDPMDAHNAYLKKKSEICLDHIELLKGYEVDERVISSLIRISNSFKQQMKG